MSTVSHSAVVQFTSNTNERIRITIPRDRVNITEPEARASMDAMITGDTIRTRFGRPAAIHSAEIIATNRMNLV